MNSKTDVVYEKFDECYGIVEKNDKREVYLKLENGERAFAFNIFNFCPGTRVLCSIKRLASPNKDILVSVASAIY